MNWLAHLVLSDRGGAFRIGNLLPDLVRANDLSSLPEEMLAGVQRHRLIDAYADAHPVVTRSASRFDPPLRRFGKVFADLFYDHFLATHWEDYCQVELPQFLEDFFRSVEPWRAALPPLAALRLDQIRDHGWMSQYGNIDELAQVLDRMGRRLRRPVDLCPAMAVLEAHYHEFQGDFLEFFPEIRREIAPNVIFPLSN